MPSSIKTYGTVQPGRRLGDAAIRDYGPGTGEAGRAEGKEGAADGSRTRLARQGVIGWVQQNQASVRMLSRGRVRQQGSRQARPGPVHHAEQRFSSAILGKVQKIAQTREGVWPPRRGPGSRSESPPAGPPDVRATSGDGTAACKRRVGRIRSRLPAAVRSAQAPADCAGTGTPGPAGPRNRQGTETTPATR